MAERFDLQRLDLPEDLRDLVAEQPDVEAWIYRDGDCLVREGEDSQDIFVLVEGALAVERAPARPGLPPAVVAAVDASEGPAIVGEMAYLGAFRRTATLRSAGASRVLRLRPRHIDRVIERCPGLTRVLCAQFSRRLKETLEALSALQARFALDPVRRMAQDGEVLFRAGEPADHVQQLMAGCVRLEDGQGVRRVGPEDLPQGLLDLGTYLAGRPRTVTATVEGMAFLADLGPQDRAAVLRCFPEAALACLAAEP